MERRLHAGEAGAMHAGVAFGRCLVDHTPRFLQALLPLCDRRAALPNQLAFALTCCHLVSFLGGHMGSMHAGDAGVAFLRGAVGVDLGLAPVMLQTAFPLDVASCARDEQLLLEVVGGHLGAGQTFQRHVRLVKALLQESPGVSTLEQLRLQGIANGGVFTQIGAALGQHCLDSAPRLLTTPIMRRQGCLANLKFTLYLWQILLRLLARSLPFAPTTGA
mmetsp:Transcript_69571/g.201605  ORF Transcript_69571/g.201605 Transcript_69571/m.201605 type:complete len:219 (+) Transcript_69571:1209-1865(+)